MEIEAADGILSASSTSLGLETLIAFEGLVDLASTTRLDAQFAEAARAGAERVTLDLSGLERIDGAVISLVLRGMGSLRAAGVHLDVRYPSQMALQLIEMCSLLQIVGSDFARGPEQNSNDGSSRATDNAQQALGTEVLDLHAAIRSRTGSVQ